MAFFSKHRHAKPPHSTLAIPPRGEVQQIHDAEKVLSLAVVLSQQNDFQELLRLIASKGLTFFNADTFTIVMVNPTTQHHLTAIRSRDP